MDSVRGNIGQRLVSRDQAASYCGLSVSTFSNWARIGRLPSALSGTSRWDLKAIDLALDLAERITHHSNFRRCSIRPGRVESEACASISKAYIK